MRPVGRITLVLGRASNSAIVSSYERFTLCIEKKRPVAQIIVVLWRASNSAVVSKYERSKFCIQKMRPVAVIILVLRRASNSVIVTSYERPKLKMRPVALIILVLGRASNSAIVSTAQKKYSRSSACPKRWINNIANFWTDSSDNEIDSGRHELEEELPAEPDFISPWHSRRPPFNIFGSGNIEILTGMNVYSDQSGS